MTIAVAYTNVMKDEDIRRIIPREVLVKQGISMVLCFIGGAFLMVMILGARIGLLGLILSVAALSIGIGALLSRNVESKKPALILVVAGVLGMMMRFRIPVLMYIAPTLLNIGALLLFMAGILKGIVFLRGLRSRS